jgi:hypothetical protein
MVILYVKNVNLLYVVEGDGEMRYKITYEIERETHIYAKNREEALYKFNRKDECCTKVVKYIEEDK